MCLLFGEERVSGSQIVKDSIVHKNPNRYFLESQQSHARNRFGCLHSRVPHQIRLFCNRNLLRLRLLANGILSQAHTRAEQEKEERHHCVTHSKPSDVARLWFREQLEPTHYNYANSCGPSIRFLV